MSRTHPNPNTRLTAVPARGPIPGWKAILVREDTFRLLQAIQLASHDAYLDLRYVGDAAVLVGLDAAEPADIVRRACDEMRSRL